MIRIVLDTNVIVSALLVPTKNEAAVLQLCLHGALELYVSASILAEYEEVLRRPKFKLDSAIVATRLHHIRATSRLVRPRQALSISPDESDNRFLECVEAAKAHYLVTGNLRHFPAEWAGTTVVTARQLIDLVIT